MFNVGIHICKTLINEADIFNIQLTKNESQWKDGL